MPGRNLVLPPAINKDKYQKECRSYLGDVGAMIFFAYSALRPEQSANELRLWTLDLQKSINAQKPCYRQPRLSKNGDFLLNPNVKIEKPQISNWKNSNPFFIAPPSKEQKALNYKIINITAVGVKTDGTAWRGNLIFIHEFQTNLIFHHFNDVSKSVKITKDDIFSYLKRADEIASKHRKAAQYLEAERKVWLPSKSASPGAILKIYDQVADKLSENQKTIPDSLSSWLPSFNVTMEDDAKGRLTKMKKRRNSSGIEPRDEKPKPISTNSSSWHVMRYPDAIEEFKVDVKSKRLVAEPKRKLDPDKPPSTTKQKNTIDTALQLGNAVRRIACGMPGRAKNDDQDLQSWHSLSPAKAHTKAAPPPKKTVTAKVS